LIDFGYSSSRSAVDGSTPASHCDRWLSLIEKKNKSQLSNVNSQLQTSMAGTSPAMTKMNE
jgi:hypothetical protein